MSCKLPTQTSMAVTAHIEESQLLNHHLHNQYCGSQAASLHESSYSLSTEDVDEN